jgi:hypothetical protein
MAYGMAGLDAVERLAVDTVRLAAHVVFHSCFREQISLIARINEHAAFEGAAAFHDDPENPRPFLHDAPGEIKPLALDDRHFVADFAQHRVVNVGGDVRLEGPHRFLVGIVHRAAPIDVLPAVLVIPRFRLLVVLPDAAVKFPRDSADGALVANVGGPETARREPAEKLRRLNQHRGPAHPRRLDHGGNAAGGPAIDDEIVGTRGAARRGHNDGRQPQSSHQTHTHAHKTTPCGFRARRRACFELASH